MVDVRQTPQYAQYMARLGWKVENWNEVYYFIKSFYISSVIKIPRPEKLEIGKIQEIARRNKSIQIIIEPKDQVQENTLNEQGFRKTPSLSGISKTLHIDLKKSKEEIMNMFAKDTKEYLDRTKDIRIYSVEDIKKFQESWRQSVSFLRHVPSVKSLVHLKNVFGENALFLVTPDGASGAIFLKGINTVHYWQAFSSKTARKNFSHYKIVWSAISWAKDTGAKVFDFEGIYDERYPRKDWKGFSHFKKSFGGKEIYYPITYSKLRFGFHLMV